jgi:hypothetical protein
VADAGTVTLLSVLESYDPSAVVSAGAGPPKRLGDLLDACPLRTDATSLKVLCQLLQYRIFAVEAKDSSPQYGHLHLAVDAGRVASVAWKTGSGNLRLHFAGAVGLQKLKDNHVLATLPPFTFCVSSLHFDRLGCETLVPAWCAPTANAAAASASSQEQQEATCKLEEVLLNITVPSALLKVPSEPLSITVKLPYVKVLEKFASEDVVNLILPSVATPSDGAGGLASKAKGFGRGKGRGRGRGAKSDPPPGAAPEDVPAAEGQEAMPVDFGKLGPQSYLATAASDKGSKMRKVKSSAPHLLA